MNVWTDLFVSKQKVKFYPPGGSLYSYITNHQSSTYLIGKWRLLRSVQRNFSNFNERTPFIVPLYDSPLLLIKIATVIKLMNRAGPRDYKKRTYQLD